MIVRCPSCGAENSLDALLDHEAAAQALNAALEFAPGGRGLVRYLALFRPSRRRLTWPRVAALLGELLPLIKGERIERDGKVYDAPLAAWASAFEKCIQARDAGTLRTPLKSHGYLFEIVIAEAARAAGTGLVLDAYAGAPLIVSGAGSATAKAINALQQRKKTSHDTSA